MEVVHVSPAIIVSSLYTPTFEPPLSFPAYLRLTVSAFKEGTASTLCLLFSLTYGHHISHLVQVMFPWFSAWLALPPCQPLVAHPHTLHPSPITDLQATRSGNFSKLLFTPLLVIPLACLFLLPSRFLIHRQGSLLFSKFEFSIKPDLRGLSFSQCGLMQFLIKCRQFSIKVRILCIYEG